MMHKSILIAFLAFYSITGLSQEDTALLELLKKPIVNCENIAFNSQEMISGLSVNQYDSIARILSLWEHECGNVEPVQRLKILFDIQLNTFVDSVYKDYIINYIDNFKNRIINAKDIKYKEIYEFNKAYFYYVPLRSNFDFFTMQFATELLKSQNAGTTTYLLCLLFSEDIENYDKEINSEQNIGNYISTTLSPQIYNDWNSGIIFSVLAGIWLPSGKLSEFFNPSPQFGGLCGIPVYKRLRVDLGIVLRPLINQREFNLLINSLPQTVNGTVCLTFGGWLTSEFKLNDKTFLDLSAGIGLGRIDTDLKMPKSNSDDKDRYYGVSTYDVSLGTNLRKKIFKRSSIGLNLSFHYAPYNLDKLLANDVGNHYATLSVFYRF